MEKAISRPGLKHLTPDPLLKERELAFSGKGGGGLVRMCGVFKPFCIIGCCFHNLHAFGPVYDEPGEESGDVDLVAYSAR